MAFRMCDIHIHEITVVIVVITPIYRRFCAQLEETIMISETESLVLNYEFDNIGYMKYLPPDDLERRSDAQKKYNMSCAGRAIARLL